MTNSSLTRYELQLDVLERDSALSDRAAIALLRSEFARAINASYLSRLSQERIVVDIRSREIPQDGVARYTVVLQLEERTGGMTDEHADELLRREFQRALNASHFSRTCRGDFRTTLLAREPAGEPVGLRG